MAQGARVSCNLFYNHGSEDLFVEVNHGPFLVDNNLLLSRYSLMDASEGGAYVHNLIAGAIATWIDLNRQTPYHPAHSTEVAGLANIKGGDSRFFNNLFAPASLSEPAERYGLSMYDAREFPLYTGGNAYYGGARPYGKERDARRAQDLDAGVGVLERGSNVYVRINPGRGLLQHSTSPVTSERLGESRVSGLGYRDTDGSPLRIETDYFGTGRDPTNPGAGPFARLVPDTQEIKVW
jgi:hypothetical protein